MDYLTITQAAERLGVSRQAVWVRIKSGVIRADRVGHYWFIPSAEIERLRTETGCQAN